MFFDFAANLVKNSFIFSKYALISSPCSSFSILSINCFSCRVAIQRINLSAPPPLLNQRAFVLPRTNVRLCPHERPSERKRTFNAIGAMLFIWKMIVLVITKLELPVFFIFLARWYWSKKNFQYFCNVFSYETQDIVGYCLAFSYQSCFENVGVWGTCHKDR